MMRKKNTNKYPWRANKEIQSGRLEEDKRYSSSRWRKGRLLKLQRDPLCEVSLQEGRVVAADVVDHIHPVRLGGSFWDESNWQSMSTSEHNRKSGFEAQFARLVDGLPINVKRKYYLEVQRWVEKKHEKQMYLIDFKEVKSFFFEVKNFRGYGVKS